MGDIFGAPLAIEGIIAFFMESTFVAVMYFGWKKVSAGFHLASTWLTGIGATFSAWWILVANSWMQYPVGCEFNPDTMRNEMVSFVDVAFSPFAVDKFCHTVTSAWIIGALFTVAVSAYYLLKKRERRLAVESIKVAAIVGLVASILAAVTGDHSAYTIAKVQPMKLAAMEALYDGGESQSLTVISWVDPFEQPDYAAGGEAPMRIGVPYLLSFMATHDFNGFVPGVNNIIKGGYVNQNGENEPSLEEKMTRGKEAIAALASYREIKAEAKGNPTDMQKQQLETQAKILKENMKYFGYGYIKDAEEAVPFIPLCFYTFRIMVGLGCLFILFFAVTLFLVYKKDITAGKWWAWCAIVLLPLGYVASESGWLVAEFGRQPWTIQDMMPTWISVSDLPSSAVMLTFFIFLVLFTALLAVEINILCKQIKKGPEYSK